MSRAPAESLIADGRAVSDIEQVWANFRVNQVFRSDAAAMLKAGGRWMGSLVTGGMVGPPRSLLDNSPLRELLSRVTDFINASVERDFTVNELASVACMSPAHFSRSFKAATGTAPHEYVSRQRLDLAKRLLLTSDRLLVDIAYATGFSSQANFNRAFRRAVGTTPSAYRAQKLRD